MLKIWDIAPFYHTRANPLESLCTMYGSSLDWTFGVDELGRPSTVMIGPDSLVEYKYNEYSEIEGMEFSHSKDRFLGIPEASSFELGLGYDEWTRSRNRISKTFLNSSKKFDSTWSRNDRGLIEQEIVNNVKRTYQYSDPRGFLSSSQEPGRSQEFEYDTEGLMTQVKDQTNVTQFTKDGDFLNIGNFRYEMDSFGRVKASGSTRYSYNGLGRVSEVVNFPKDRIEYGYDEQGVRLFKKIRGVVREVYQGDAIYDGESLYEPLKITGVLVDVLKDGRPMGVTADMRGSVVLNGSEAFNLPSAYGERTQRSVTSRIVDFASQGFDKDLGAYHMDHRDYDPVLKRFHTPDPLFFENPEKCVESPHECNLYSYAKENPVSFVDPSGLNTHKADRGITPLDSFVFNYSDSKNSPTHTFVFTTKFENGVEKVDHTYSWGNDGKSWTVPDQKNDLTAAQKALDGGLSKMIGDSSLDPYVAQAYKQLQSFDIHPWKLSDTCKDGADRLVQSAQETKFNDQVRIENAISGRGSEQNSSSMSNFGITK